MCAIGTTLAFLEGVRCAEGLPPSPFFDRKHSLPAGDGVGENPSEAAPAPKDADEAEAMEALGEGVWDRMRAVEGHAKRSTELMLRVLERAAEERAGELLGVWEAFGRFCQGKLGLTPERALMACGKPVMEEMELTLGLCGDVKADEAAVAEFAEALCGVWERGFRTARRNQSRWA